MIDNNQPLANLAEKTAISLKLLLPLLAAVMALSPLAIDMYLPAMPVIANDLHTQMPAVQNTLSVYLFGYALGLLLFGPLADKHSRRKLVIFGVSGFLVASLLLPFTVSIEQFLSVRFIQALVSSAATVVIPGTIREYYGKDTAKGLSYVSMIMMLAPMIAPSVGSLLLLVGSWHIIFFVLSTYSFIILLLVIKYLPEARREKISTQQQVSFLGRYKIVFSHRKARLDIMSSMVISLAFFAYITAIPFVYLTVFSTSEFTFSVLFAINVIALMTSHFINTKMVVRKGSRKMLWYGLSLAILASSFLVAVNYWHLSLVYTVLAVLPLMGSIAMIAVNCDALVLTQFAEQSGTATAVIGTLRFGIGALAGPILAWFYDGSALPFALLMWGSVMVVLLCQTVISKTSS